MNPLSEKSGYAALARLLVRTREEGGWVSSSHLAELPNPVELFLSCSTYLCRRSRWIEAGVAWRVKAAQHQGQTYHAPSGLVVVPMCGCTSGVLADAELMTCTTAQLLTVTVLRLLSVSLLGVMGRQLVGKGG